MMTWNQKEQQEPTKESFVLLLHIFALIRRQIRAYCAPGAHQKNKELYGCMIR